MNGTSRNSHRVAAVLLSGLLLTASSLGGSSPAAAQSELGPPSSGAPSPGPPASTPGPESGPSTGGGGSSIGRDVGEAAAIAVGVGIVWILLQRVFTPPPPSSGPPPDTFVYQPPTGPESSGTQPSEPRRFARHFGNHNGNGTPPRGEQRFIPDEIIVEFSSNASPQSIDQIARRHHLTQLESQSLPLIGATLFRLHIIGGHSVASVIGALQNENFVARVQPNYVFALQEEALKTRVPTQGDASQYVLDKLHIKQAHQIATGKGILVAVIDSEIDAKHPDLDGTVTKSFNALTREATPDQHGTAMAGAIAAHGELLGIAPDAQILAEHAFDAGPGTAKGTSFSIYKSLQWAADNDARVVNMSFAGPADPTLHRLLAAANEKDMVLIAAAGNAGPNSPPLYPAADPNVIAVTATDSNDEIYKMANRGPYIAVAAPGVEILALAPDESYLLTTGTSVAAAHVSGIVALLLERKASLSPKDIRTILTTTATPLGSGAPRSEFGAGLVDAYRAVLLANGKSAARTDNQQAKQ